MTSNPQDLAAKVLNERFGCDKSVIAIGQVDPKTLAACKHIGGGFLDFGPVALGEIADCLAEAGLLVTPQASSAERSEEEVCRCAPTPSALREDSAVYIRLSKRPVHHTTHHFNESVHVDMDDYDEPVGVEILGAVEVTVDGQVVGLECE